MNGLERISAAFEYARKNHTAALMPYYTLGYPNPATSLEIIRAVARSGADLIELGIPFSDPLADGRTIQRSTQAALEAGMNVSRCLEIVRRLRDCGIQQPLLLMGYYNPLLAYGLEHFVTDAARCGTDGLIVPDLPPEEAGALEAACQEHGLALTFLLAPTSTPERIALIAGRTTGFLYLVSLTGVTGARQSLPDDLEAFVRRVRPVARTPLAVGFGIATPEQARRVGKLVDGVIVGSAVIDAVARGGFASQAAADFISGLHMSLQKA